MCTLCGGDDHFASYYQGPQEEVYAAFTNHKKHPGFAYGDPSGSATPVQLFQTPASQAPVNPPDSQTKNLVNGQGQRPPFRGNKNYNGHLNQNSFAPHQNFNSSFRS